MEGSTVDDRRERRPREKVAGMGAVMNTIRKRGTSRIWDTC